MRRMLMLVVAGLLLSSCVTKLGDPKRVEVIAVHVPSTLFLYYQVVAEDEQKRIILFDTDHFVEPGYTVCVQRYSGGEDSWGIVTCP